MTPCNSCTASATSCNRRRIYDNLFVQLTFLSNTARGRIKVTTDRDDNQTDLTYSAAFGTNDIIAANTSVTVRILWSEICNKLFNGTTGCDSADKNSTVKIRLGVDVPDTATSTTTDDKLTSADDFTTEVQFTLADIGVTAGSVCSNGAAATSIEACNFIAYPGDEKVFIDEVRAGCSFPTVPSSAASIQSLRVLYKEGSAPAVNEGTFSDLQVTSTNQTCSNDSKPIGLIKNEISGLKNDTTYFFRLALVDQANNVGFFMDNSTLTLADKDNNSNCYDPNQWEQNCHISTPTKVVGLIGDELDCFITTATYGSPFEPQVKIFRQFRNQFLKTNLLGRFIIKTYYKLSPPIATWIHENPQLKPIARFLLWPYWLVARIFLNTQLLFILSFLILSIFIIRSLKRGTA